MSRSGRSDARRRLMSWWSGPEHRRRRLVVVSGLAVACVLAAVATMATIAAGPRSAAGAFPASDAAVPRESPGTVDDGSGTSSSAVGGDQGGSSSGQDDVAEQHDSSSARAALEDLRAQLGVARMTLDSGGPAEVDTALLRMRIASLEASLAATPLLRDEIMPRMNEGAAMIEQGVASDDEMMIWIAIDMIDRALVEFAGTHSG